MLFIAIILAVFFGCSISLLIVSGKVVKSNDLGNTKGSFNNFSKDLLNVIVKQDRIKRPKL